MSTSLFNFDPGTGKVIIRNTCREVFVKLKTHLVQFGPKSISNLDEITGLINRELSAFKTAEERMKGNKSSNPLLWSYLELLREILKIISGETKIQVSPSLSNFQSLRKDPSSPKIGEDPANQQLFAKWEPDRETVAFGWDLDGPEAFYYIFQRPLHKSQFKALEKLPMNSNEFLVILNNESILLIQKFMRLLSLIKPSEMSKSRILDEIHQEIEIAMLLKPTAKHLFGSYIRCLELIEKTLMRKLMLSDLMNFSQKDEKICWAGFNAFPQDLERNFWVRIVSLRREWDGELDPFEWIKQIPISDEPSVSEKPRVQKPRAETSSKKKKRGGFYDPDPDLW
jgi:hypothetical protein